MSEVTDLVIQISESVGWSFILFVVFIYEIYFPRRLHWKGGTRLQHLLMEPSPGVVAALESLAEEVEGVSQRLIVEKLDDNGYHSWQFKNRK
jgi:hypothetical protein